MKQHLIAAAASLLTATLLTGCAEQTPPTARLATEINSEAAVMTARRDAQSRFNLAEPASVAVSRAGRYWVIDIRAASGGGVHYAIAADGTIRERRTTR